MLSIVVPFLLDAALHPLGEMEEVSGITGLRQILKQCVELRKCAFEVALDVLKLLISPFVDDLRVHSVYIW